MTIETERWMLPEKRERRLPTQQELEADAVFAKAHAEAAVARTAAERAAVEAADQARQNSESVQFPPPSVRRSADSQFYSLDLQCAQADETP
jgi:hypothetical protein